MWNQKHKGWDMLGGKQEQHDRNKQETLFRELAEEMLGLRAGPQASRQAVLEALPMKGVVLPAAVDEPQEERRRSLAERLRRTITGSPSHRSGCRRGMKSRDDKCATARHHPNLTLTLYPLITLTVTLTLTQVPDGGAR